MRNFLVTLGVLSALITSPASAQSYGEWLAQGQSHPAAPAQPAPAASASSTRDSTVDPYRPTYAQQHAPDPSRDGVAHGADAQTTCEPTAAGGQTCYAKRAPTRAIDWVSTLGTLAVVGLAVSHENNYGYSGSYGSSTIRGGGRAPQACGYYGCQH